MGRELMRTDGTAAGTHLYRHKPTDTDRAPYSTAELNAMGYRTPQAFMAGVVDAHTNDADKWEKLATVPFRFNRLMIFRPQQYHDAGLSFGNSKENGRLVYINLYNAADARRM